MPRRSTSLGRPAASRQKCSGTPGTVRRVSRTVPAGAQRAADHASLWESAARRDAALDPPVPFPPLAGSSPAPCPGVGETGPEAEPPPTAGAWAGLPVAGARSRGPGAPRIQRSDWTGVTRASALAEAAAESGPSPPSSGSLGRARWDGCRTGRLGAAAAGGGAGWFAAGEGPWAPAPGGGSAGAPGVATSETRRGGAVETARWASARSPAPTPRWTAAEATNARDRPGGFTACPGGRRAGARPRSVPRRARARTAAPAGPPRAAPPRAPARALAHRGEGAWSR